MLQKFPLFYHDIILHPPFNYSRWKNIPEPSSLPDFFAVDVILLAVDVILRPLQPPLFIFQVTQKYLATQNTMTPSPALFRDAKKLDTQKTAFSILKNGQ